MFVFTSSFSCMLIGTTISKKLFLWLKYDVDSGTVLNHLRSVISSPMHPDRAADAGPTRIRYECKLLLTSTYNEGEITRHGHRLGEFEADLDHQKGPRRMILSTDQNLRILSLQGAHSAGLAGGSRAQALGTCGLQTGISVALD